MLGPYEREKNRMGKDKSPCQRQKFFCKCQLKRENQKNNHGKGAKEKTRP